MTRLFLTSLIVIFWSTLVVVEAHKKVRLRDVQAITLQKGLYTNGRRSSSVPQLTCVGGRARNEQHAETVQCYNRGFDGVDVQWECKAELPAHLRLGKISVSCEGYDYPDDPYILAGSCGLEYELEYANNNYENGHSSSIKQSLVDKLVHLAMTLGFVFILVLIVSRVCEDARSRRGARTHSAPSAPPPDDDFRGDGRGPPPPYDDNDRRDDYPGFQGKTSSSSYGWNVGGDTRPRGTGRRSQNQQDGPGFWSGVGLGALGGYMFGSSRNGRHQTGNTWGNNAGSSGSWGNQGGTTRSSAGTSTSSSATHTSTSYGGTTRR